MSKRATKDLVEALRAEARDIKLVNAATPVEEDEPERRDYAVKLGLLLKDAADRLEASVYEPTFTDVRKTTGYEVPASYVDTLRAGARWHARAIADGSIDALMTGRR